MTDYTTISHSTQGDGNDKLAEIRKELLALAEQATVTPRPTSGHHNGSTPPAAQPKPPAQPADDLAKLIEQIQQQEPERLEDWVRERKHQIANLVGSLTLEESAKIWDALLRAGMPVDAVTKAHDEVEKIIWQKRLSLEDFLLVAGMSDEGNAQCVARLHAGRFLHSKALGWLAYTGTHWTTENAEALLDRAIVDTLIRRIEAASSGKNPEEHERMQKLRKFCAPNRGRVEGAKALLSSIVCAETSEFESDPDLLNCKNGVIDLRTGRLTPHDPAQRFMHCVTVDYKPDADPTVWLDWLREAVGEEMANWLQLAIGYTLTGRTNEEILFYLFGPPRSGKGVFTETMLSLLGEPLSKEVNFSTFTEKRDGNSQNFDLAPLKPCRFVAADESNAYERFNEAKVKMITGGGKIHCSFKYKDHFNYKPQYKLWLSSNHPINADPDDDAVWSRFRLIHFPTSHLGSEDKRLKERMRSRPVLEGLLAWAVQGAMKWYALDGRGLREPASSAALKQEQRGASDSVGMWIEERCIVGEQHYAGTTPLYQDYEYWCKESGFEPKKHKNFSIALQHKGYKPERRIINGKRTRVFLGLGIMA
jgi:putative DNA primase/helicase